MDSPVPCEHQPWCCASVHVGKVIDYPMILLGATAKVMLGAHDDKMNQTIIKSKPANKEE